MLHFKSTFREIVFILLSIFQTETLETILGVRENNSSFFSKADSRVTKDLGSKQGTIPDSLHGKTINSSEYINK